MENQIIKKIIFYVNGEVEFHVQTCPAPKLQDLYCANIATEAKENPTYLTIAAIVPT